MTAGDRIATIGTLTLAPHAPTLPPMSAPRPRAAILHPVAIGALALLLVNDHVLKSAWPGWWTGKLSDVAALIVGTVTFAALGQLAVGDRRRTTSRIAGPWSVELVVAIVVGLWFAAVKTLPVANEAYAVIMGVAGWPFGALGDLIAARPSGPVGLAPTRLDHGDLIALPAVVVGWWLATGARPSLPRRRSRPLGQRRPPPVLLTTTARVAVLGLATFALAATSYSPPRSVTVLDRDAVTVVAGGPAVHRTAIVAPPSISGQSEPEALSGVSIRVQARPLWPLNDPPVRFGLTVAGVGAASGDAPVVDVPATACVPPCELAVDVAVEWTGASARGETSVAWELVVTAEALQSGYVSGTGRVVIDGSPPDGAARSLGLILGGLTVVPLVVMGLGSGPIGHRVSRRLASLTDRRRRLDIVVISATAAVVAILAWAMMVVLPAPGIEPVTGAEPLTLGILAGALVAALVGGLVTWSRGSAIELQVAVGVTAILALPVGAILVGSASPTFARLGVLVGGVMAAALSVPAFAASSRGTAMAAPNGSRIFVLITQLAVVGLLFVATPGFGTGVSAVLGLLHLFALGLWWEGGARGLAVTSLLIAAGAALATVTAGPNLIVFAYTEWTAVDRAVQYAVIAGAIVGLIASIVGNDGRSAEPGADAAEPVEAPPAES
jgi:hypothetical protein